MSSPKRREKEKDKGKAKEKKGKNGGFGKASKTKKESVVLPPDWTAVEDPTGRVFYLNLVTKKTTWKLPKASDAAAMPPVPPQHAEAKPKFASSSNAATAATAASAATAATTTTSSSSSHDFDAHVDKDTGRTFFVNKKTQEATWDPPAQQKNEKVPVAFATPVIAMRPEKVFDSSVSPRRARAPAPAHGELQTAELVDDDEDEPQEQQQEGAADEALPQRPPSLTSFTLPSGWTPILDPNTGRYFFHRRDTGAVQWEVPTEPAELPAVEPAKGDDDDGWGGSNDERNANAVAYRARMSMEEAKEEKRR
jgi:hypothetical protein